MEKKVDLTVIELQTQNQSSVPNQEENEENEASNIVQLLNNRMP